MNNLFYTFNRFQGLVLCGALFLVFYVNQAFADTPVFFADANLKTRVENKLGVVDPEPADMLALTELRCDYAGISDLTGLEYATNLQWLWTADNQISDLSPLSNLTHLNYLMIAENRISSLSDLSGLINLQEINLHRNYVSDLSPLSGLTQLHTVIFYNNDVSDISPLAELPNLSVIYGHNDDAIYGSKNSISDISALASMTSLTTLDLSGNPLTRQDYCVHVDTILNDNPGLFFWYDPFTGPPESVLASQGTHLDHVQISWSEVCNGPDFTSHYRVWRSAGQDPQKMLVGNWQQATTLNDTSAQLGVSYTYWVQTAISNDGEYARDEFSSAQGWVKGSLPNPGPDPSLFLVYVDAAGPSDPGPGNPLLSDPDEDGSSTHPFDSIQKAIDQASSGATIHIQLGTYRENLVIRDKTLYLQGTEPNESSGRMIPVIDGTFQGPVVQITGLHAPMTCSIHSLKLRGGQDSQHAAVASQRCDVTLDHCVIVGNRIVNGLVNSGIVWAQDSTVTVNQCTLANNYAGEQGAGLVMINSTATVTNSILWNNLPFEIQPWALNQISFQYSDVAFYMAIPGQGNLSQDPRFVQPGYWAQPDSPWLAQAVPNNLSLWIPGNYGLQSSGGHWDPANGWMLDPVMSPCVDRGDTQLPIGQESVPHGDRINIGAYGGTARASKSITQVPQTPVLFKDEKLKKKVEDTLYISDPTPLDMLRLTKLHASFGNIKDLTGLEFAINLQWLRLDDNQIVDLSPLRNLTNLTYLHLGNNRINELSHLQKLTKLTYLNVHRNSLSTLYGLEGMTQLEELEAYDNESLYDIAPLRRCLNLRVVYLQTNAIYDLEALTYHHALQTLDLRWNALDQTDYCTYIPLIEQHNPTIDLWHDDLGICP